MTDITQESNVKPYVLWLMLLTFVAPIIAAFWLYQIGGTDLTVNRGELLSKPAQILELQLHDEQGRPATEQQLFGKWHLLVFTDGQCDADCEKRIYELRQVKTSLHKESDRLINVAVHLSSQMDAEFNQKMQSHYERFKQYIADQQWISQQLGYDSDRFLKEQHVFMVDPIGNIILRYGPNNSPRDMLDDLKRLLKASQIG